MSIEIIISFTPPRSDVKSYAFMASAKFEAEDEQHVKEILDDIKIDYPDAEIVSKRQISYAFAG